MSAPKPQIIEMLITAYSMELETVTNYLANSINLDGVRAEEIKKSLQADVTDRDQLARALDEESFPCTVVRPSHTYDCTLVPPEGGWTIVDRMRRGEPVVVHGDGSSIWTLTHHRDFAKGFVGLLGCDAAIGEAFHITSDEWLTWDRIHHLLARAAGTRAEIVHVPSEIIARYDRSWGDSLLGDKTHSMIFDNSKIKRFVPDYGTRIPFHVGVRKTLAWFEADPRRQRIVDETNQIMDRYIAAWRAAPAAAATQRRSSASAGSASNSPSLLVVPAARNSSAARDSPWARLAHRKPPAPWVIEGSIPASATSR